MKCVVFSQRMMDVNFFGTFSVTQAVVRHMKQRESRVDASSDVSSSSTAASSDRQGIIVLTSSQGGLLGIYGFTGYAAAKAALIKFGEALHMEVQEEWKPQILANNICPILGDVKFVLINDRLKK